MELKIPYLEVTPHSKQLVVNDKPFLIRGAELQNSSMSSADYMKDVWPRLVEANINTVLGPITWEQIEPEEGKFDFKELDSIIQGARDHGLHLILLWFGSFKNGFSIYTPAWVKTNQRRFPRAILRKTGGRMEIGNTLSLFYSEALEADVRAFKALMQHLKEVDEKDSTVIMVQVENEVGLLGDSRDGSVAATRRFNDPVPDELLTFLAKDWDGLNLAIKRNLQYFRTQLTIRNSSWESVFGSYIATDELFMAYHYALYLDQVAAAGKAIYPIPLFTNVWLAKIDNESDGNSNVVSGGAIPGEYPSGGGVASVLDIWQRFAPSLDFISPDIYQADYTKACATYRHRDQPLFIPEQRRDEYGARRIWYAFGSHQAIGTAPFGIDTLKPSSNPFKKHYGLLKQVEVLVLASQRRPNSSIGFFFDEFVNGKVKPESLEVTFGTWKLKIERSLVFGRPGPGFGMVIHLQDSRFLLIGEGFQVTFTSSHPSKLFTGILHFLEKDIDTQTGELRTLRMLNGDETRSGRFCIMPGENPDYGGFPVAATIPARTRIAECEPYALEWDDSL